MGMLTMTGALRTIAGDRLRVLLLRFTRTPATGAMTGTLATAFLQSSSATTVAAIGFVGAELMTFPAALGIIFGANLGTTITGWIVAIIGFKLNLGSAALPLIFIGAVVKLLGRKGWADWGMALAGFGLIFLGIELMQEGMGGLEQTISFAALPGDTLLDRLLLVLVGLILTLITQSSSAGVAATLTALFAGLLDFQQAAALVIGMDVGTSFTGLIASLAGSASARRTGLSHVVFNVFTAVGALALITPYVALWAFLVPGGVDSDPEIALVGFHSMFNALSVLVVLPFAGPFARLIERMIPDPSSSMIKRLDTALLEEPALAIATTQRVVQDVFIELLGHVRRLVSADDEHELTNLADLRRTLQHAYVYVDEIHLANDEGADWRKLLALIHSLDHMQRLHERLAEESYRAAAAREAEALTAHCEALRATTERVADAMLAGDWPKAKEVANETSKVLDGDVKAERAEVILSMGIGTVDVPTGTTRLEAIRWLQRVSHHIAEISTHLFDCNLAAAAP